MWGGAAPPRKWGCLGGRGCAPPDFFFLFGMVWVRNNLLNIITCVFFRLHAKLALQKTKKLSQVSCRHRLAEAWSGFASLVEDGESTVYMAAFRQPDIWPWYNSVCLFMIEPVGVIILTIDQQIDWLQTLRWVS